MALPEPLLDTAKLLEQLRELGAIGHDAAQGGRTRIALTDEEKAGRDLLVRWMRELDLEVRVDQIGNIFGVLHAEHPPPRQNSCRLHRTKNPGAAMKDDSGSIRTIIQGQGSGQAATAGERGGRGGGAGGWCWSSNPGALARGCAVQARPRAGLDCGRPV